MAHLIWSGRKVRHRLSDDEGSGLVRKETGFLTNCPWLVVMLKRECTNRTGERPWHRHVHIIGGGRAKKAQVYPAKLVKAVLTAIKNQRKDDGEIGSLEAGGPSPHEPLIAPQSPDVAEELGRYWDDVKGGWLEPRKVEKAREEEVHEVIKYKVIDVVPRQRLIDSGKRPIDTRWSDTNKGTEEEPAYRSRLCAREMKHRQVKGWDEMAGSESDLFASMPPIEVVKILFSEYVSRQMSRSRKCLKVGLYDVRRAHFNAEATRDDLFIEIPDELIPEGKTREEVIGVLLKCMYGTRDAAANWDREFASCFIAAGFKQGIACPNIFYHEERDILSINHGDDAHVLGDQEAQEFTQKILTDRYEIKVRAILGPEPTDDKEATFLNRTIRILEDNSVEIEADRRHAKEIARIMGVSDGKSVTTPIIKEPNNVAEMELPDLDKERCKTFRSVTMRACYMAIDRTDVQYAVKECAREMHCPTERGWTRLKRLARYLVRVPRVIIQFQRQHSPSKITLYCDSDHAGCKLTRKSTSGLCAMLGGHCVKTSATTQSTIGLSSPESEYYALVKACSNGLGIQSLMRDMGRELEVHVHCDASSGISLANRRGLGRARHVSARFLWVQQRVARKEVFVHKVNRKLNPSDIGTRCNSEMEIDNALSLLNMHPALGMSEVSPKKKSELRHSD